MGAFIERHDRNPVPFAKLSHRHFGGDRQLVEFPAHELTGFEYKNDIESSLFLHRVTEGDGLAIVFD